MPANPLTPDQAADAARLKQLFSEWQRKRKDDNEPSSQEVASEMLGFNQSAMSQYLNGKIPLNVSAATRFATLLGCTLSEFSPSLAQQAAKYATVADANSDGVPFVRNASRVTTQLADDTVPVKLVNLRLEAGFPGFDADQEFDDGGVVNIPRREIDENDWVPHCLLAIKVRGDSMAPVFHDRDTVVINIADTRPTSGEVYAINFDGKPVIKQLVHEGRDWWMYSFNRSPEFARRIFRSPESAVVGKVVYQPGRRVAGRLG